MAKCPLCGARKGKRACPALSKEICPSCCAEGRLKTISCPSDCPHLAGEIYQHNRRRERASVEGREFLQNQERLFDDPAAREFAFRLQCDIYFFARQNGEVDDAAAAESLSTLETFLSKIFVPPGSSQPLARFLMERMADEKRYSVPGLREDDKRKAVKKLADHIRSVARGASRRYQKEIAGFFDALDFEADLDYSPLDRPAAPAEAAPPPRSPGGLILPPGY
jgi:hypothetical protein